MRFLAAEVEAGVAAAQRSTAGAAPSSRPTMPSSSWAISKGCWTNCSCRVLTSSESSSC